MIRYAATGGCREQFNNLGFKELDVTDDDHRLTNPTFFMSGDPKPIFKRWRAEDPVHWTKGGLTRGFWSVTRFTDVKTVLLNDTRVFSTQQSGVALPANSNLENPDTSYFLHLLQSGAQLSVMDGQPHTHLRKAFNNRFSSKSINALEHLVRRCAQEIIDSVIDKGECDFTAQVAGRLPLVVIGSLMDIPESDTEQLYRFSNMMAAPEDPDWSVGDPLATSSAATRGMMEYLTALAKERRKKPGDDLISQLATIEIDGVKLSDDHLGFNGLMFFGAGHETTRAALSGGLLELIHNPDQFEALRRVKHDNAALQTAGEEMVRWASPLTHALRTATEDFELNGTLIKQGDWVVAWFLSANRDEEAFVDPEKFDIRRTPNHHLGFAAGKHFCLGAHLARLEMQVMLELILENIEHIELAGPVEMAASNLFWGIKRLPIRFTRRTA